MSTNDLSQRKPSPHPPNIIKVGAIELDTDGPRVSVGGKRVALSTKEVELLRVLMESKGEVVTREFLLRKFWGYEDLISHKPRTIDVYILRLRRRLGPEGRRILTVRSLGYRFDVSVDWIKFGP